jgi:hypothetical protein
MTNTLDLALRDIKSSNPKVQKIGYTRLFSQLLVTGGVASAGAATGLSALSGSSVTEQEDKDLRKFVAPWDKEGSLGYVDRDGTKFSFFNMSYIDPYNMVNEPIRAAARSKNTEDLAENVTESILRSIEPFTSLDLVAQATTAIAQNENEFGGYITPPGASQGRKAKDYLAYAFDKTIKPGFFDTAKEMGYAFDLMDPEDGKRYSPGEEILGAVGLRISNVDVARSFEFRANDYEEDLRDVRGVFNEAKYKEGATLQEKFDAMEEANRLYRERFKEMNEVVEAGYRLGMNWPEIEKKLKDAGVPNDEVEDLKRGAPTPYLTPADITEDE